MPHGATIYLDRAASSSHGRKCVVVVSGLRRVGADQGRQQQCGGGQQQAPGPARPRRHRRRQGPAREAVPRRRVMRRHRHPRRPGRRRIRKCAHFSLSA
jgi:hypothetical protein